MAAISEPDTLINEITGDLFSCAPADALVHCVSQDLAMGKGIAVEFKKRFASVGALKAQQKKVGEVAVLKISAFQQSSNASAANIPAASGGYEDRYIYYMITKLKYFNKPTLDDFSASLKQLKELAVTHKILALSMPRIGCGLDKLEWKVVKKLIAETFHGTNIVINVYSL